MTSRDRSFILTARDCLAYVVQEIKMTEEEFAVLDEALEVIMTIDERVLAKERGE